MRKRKKKKYVPKDIEALRQELDEWRESQEKRAPLPETFWQKATELAREFGISQVARHLRLHHTKLKLRALADDKSDLERALVPETSTFIELKPNPIFEASEAERLVVALRGADGSEMTLHLPPSQTLDVARVVEGFFRR